MKKRILFTLPLFLAAGILCGADRPNILMIAVDDMNDWVGVYGGHPQCLTPNLDKLAETSMVFRNASCPGPVCGPSRSALLSGFMPSTTGIYGNGNNMLDSKVVQTHATLPEYFSKHGYITISKGKIFHKHTTRNGMDHGHWAFDVWEQEKGDRGGGIDQSKLYSRTQGIINGKKIKDPKHTGKSGSPFEFGPTEGGKEVTKDYMTAQWFAKKLQEDYDKPFFMSVGISKPHLPFVVPQEYFDLYDLDSVKIPEYRMDDLDDIVDDQGRKKFKPHLDFLWCREYGVFKEAVRAYMASITYADACVGVILDSLEKSPHADNTIVIVWGDHGWHLGEKLKFRKASLWREATQLPFIMRIPGMDSGQDCTRNVNLIDLYPTLIDLCGLPNKELDGKSIKPLLENPQLKWTPTLTTQGEGNHSVISEKWHYIVYRDGVEELYDLETDPMEWTNLARTRSEKLDGVKKYLRSFIPDRDAPEIPKSDKDKDAKNLDLTIKPRRDLSKLDT
jgi:arylsulfatase A-like enzyme